MEVSIYFLLNLILSLQMPYARIFDITPKSIQTSIMFENANNSTIPPNSSYFFSTYLLKSPSMWSIYTSLLSLKLAINCLRAYEPKDP